MNQKVVGSFSLALSLSPTLSRIAYNSNAHTRYRSEETLTRMRSSPTLTFSPSDRCLEAGWMVHQHASPGAMETEERGRRRKGGAGGEEEEEEEEEEVGGKQERRRGKE